MLFYTTKVLTIIEYKLLLLCLYYKMLEFVFSYMKSEMYKCTNTCINIRVTFERYYHGLYTIR